jgi:pentapeptide MXKDX repeat protein
MKLASMLTNVNKAMNWKVLAVIAGLLLSTNLIACSTSQTVPADAMKGDSMKKDGDAMKGDSMKKDGDAMKGDSMKKDGDAMKGDSMKKDGDAMKGDSMKKDGDKQKSPSPTASNKP